MSGACLCVFCHLQMPGNWSASGVMFCKVQKPVPAFVLRPLYCGKRALHPVLAGASLAQCPALIRSFRTLMLVLQDLLVIYRRYTRSGIIVEACMHLCVSWTVLKISKQHQYEDFLVHFLKTKSELKYKVKLHRFYSIFRLFLCGDI